jgi:CIC family chloride channel protein
MNGTSLAKFRYKIRHLPRRSRSVVLAAIYAAGGGISAVFFQLAMNWLYRGGLVHLSHKSTTAFLLGSFGLTVGGALISGIILAHFGKDAAGSGIPQLKRAFWQDFGFVPLKLAWVKFVAATLQIGGGCSLGREGPSVQIAGTVSSNLALAAGVSKQKLRRGAATGAAAGLAAAFNTPLAAVTFVLEEIIGDLNSRLLGGILLAATVGALVTHAVFGPQPAFSVSETGEPGWRAYLLVPVVGVAAALVGTFFQTSSLYLRGGFFRRTTLPQWILPTIGGLICWSLGVAVFLGTGHLGVFALGYDDLSAALAGSLSWKLAALLLVTKFVATVSCYGSGGSGGIFSPTLFFGGMTGLAIAGAAQSVFALRGNEVAILAIIGMSATLGAAVRAPVTSILIVFEMTHEFSLVPPLMIAALVSQAVSRRLAKHNFYDALLEQDGHHTERFAPPFDLRAWQDQPVSAFAQSKPVLIESLERESLSKLMREYRFERFPFVKNGRAAGVISRIEAEVALRENREPLVKDVVTCRPDESIREVETRLVESSAGLVVVQSKTEVLGLFTLHDLLRAQMAAADQHDSLAD